MDTLPSVGALLRTKLYIPPLRPEWVSRPRLIERLDAGLDRKLTLVSAPAGFGKTTLLGEWIASHRRGGPRSERRGTDACPRGRGTAVLAPGEPTGARTAPLQVAWLSLDEGDDDPIRFLTYLIAALQQADEGIGQDLLASLHALQPRPSLVQDSLSACINQIDARSARGRIVLVLDDYHLITSPEIHRALVYLLDHLPRNLHLVIATRADPPLHLSRLRGRGQLSELRQSDLSFSAGEVASYATQVMGVELSPEDVALLTARTEGWVTGLQMAALAVQRRDAANVSAFLATLSGRQEHIVDYFVDEVLSSQPDSVQTFLLHTSILERLSGPLCDAVCDVQGEGVELHSGQRVLERLQEANLFLISLDDERRWYRYHRLFADLLRQRLLQSDPVLVPELHRRASRWYEGSGFIEEAIDHALRGDDPGQAALLIEQVAEEIFMRGQLVLLTAWFDALPDEMTSQRPMLGLYRAAVLLLDGEPPSRIQPYLRAAATQGIPAAVTLGTTVLRALIALWQGDVAQSIELGRQALASLPEHDLFWRGTVAANLGIAYLYGGTDPDLGEQMLQQAARMGEQAGNVMGAVIALCNLAELRVVQGQLDAAKTLYDRALALATDDLGHRLPIAGMAVAGLAGLLQEWNELEQAERLLATAADLDDAEIPVGILAVDGHLALARVKASQGEIQAAQAAIDRARTAAVGTGATEFDDWLVAAMQARLWIAQGQLERAAGWARRRGLVGERGDGTRAKSSGDVGPGTAPYFVYELERLALAELWMAQGEVERAIDLLEALLARSRALQRTDTAIKVLILIALAFHRLQRPDQALAALAQALTLAQPGRYVRTFVDRGAPMADLLLQALAQGKSVDYVRRLLAAFPPGRASSARRPELVEPLSDRELQVLRLLATHLSNAEIGEQLTISVNTVRFHARNIYAKLNVHARSDAVQRARELGLL